MVTTVQDVLNGFSSERRRNISKVADRIFKELQCETIKFETIELMEHKDGIFLKEILDKNQFKYIAMIAIELSKQEEFKKVKMFITSKGKYSDTRSCHLEKEEIFLQLQIPAEIKKKIRTIEEE